MTGLVLSLLGCICVASVLWDITAPRRAATRERRLLRWARRICPCQKGAK